MRIYYASHDSANTIIMPNSMIWHNNLYLTLAKQHEMLLPKYNVQEQHVKCVYNTDGERE